MRPVSAFQAHYVFTFNDIARLAREDNRVVHSIITSASYCPVPKSLLDVGSHSVNKSQLSRMDRKQINTNNSNGNITIIKIINTTILGKMSPRNTLVCSYIFLVPRDHNCICFHLKIEFRSCARRRHWCDIFHYHWCTASIKLRLLVSSCRLCFHGAFPFLSWINVQFFICQSRHKLACACFIFRHRIFFKNLNPCMRHHENIHKYMCIL